MEVAVVVAREAVMMLLLAGLGVYCRKIGMLTTDTARNLSSLLLLVVIPAMAILLFQQEKQPDLMYGFWRMYALAAALLLMSILIATLIIRPKAGSSRYKIERLAVALPNCGFMAVPLLQSSVGDAALLYGAIFVGVFNVLVWVWAVPLLKGEKKPSLRLVFINPCIICIAAGSAMFLLGIKLPSLPASLAAQISGINTPISMLMTGIFFADLKPRDIFLNPRVYLIVFMRNLMFPLLALFAFYFTGASAYLGKMLVFSCVIMMSCPSAASAVLLPARYGGDSVYASQLIAVTSAFSICTLPLMAFLADILL